MATKTYQTITAKYKGTCCVCGKSIKPGDEIKYAKGEPVFHASCEMPEIPADAIRISGGSGYGYEGWSAGEIVWNEKRSAGSTRQKASREINDAKAAWRDQNESPRYPADWSGPEYDLYKAADKEYCARRDAAFAEIESACPGDDGPEFLYVLVATQSYYREDGMSFGVGDESGYVYSATCRAATDEESAPLRAKIAESQRRQDAEERRKKLASFIRDNGEFPERAKPEGIEITDRQNIYGGGDWLVLGEDKIWYIRNNGADGDCWAYNNVGTGGAGAMGWVIERTDEMTTELLAIEAVLDPATAERRERMKAGTITSIVYQKHFAGRIDDIWGEPASAPASPPRIAFVTLAEAETQEAMTGAESELSSSPQPYTVTVRPAILAGIDSEGKIWLATHYSEAYGEYEVYGFLAGNYAFAVSYEATPDRVAAVSSLLPSWCPIELIQTERAANRAAMDARVPFDGWRDRNPAPAWRQDFTDEEKHEYMDARKLHEAVSTENYRAGERAAKEAREAVWSRLELINGRYYLSDGPVMTTWASNNRLALWRCQIDGLSLNDVRLEPVELIYNNGESRIGGRPFQLWSDGRATTGGCEGTGSTEISKPISSIIGAALRQKYWQEDQRWKKLLDIEEIVATCSLDSSQSGGHGGGETRALDELSIRGGQIDKLYRVTIDWWSMGEDGDAGDDVYIFESEADARNEFKRGV